MALVTAVTPNPAVDVTYFMPHFDPHGTTRVTRVVETPGGKGINVARVARQLGADVTAVVPLGGQSGAWIREELEGEGISVEATAVAGSTRRTLTIVDEHSGHPPTLTEPGAAMSAREWADFVALIAHTPAHVVTVSGSLPPGIAPADLGMLIRGLADRQVVVDTSGPALLSAAEAGASLLKPNADELRAATGESDLVSAARRLVHAGARAVVVSRGPGGLLLVGAEGAWQTVGLKPVDGNPTGAGDATVAALAVGLAEGMPLPDILRTAAACGSAAVRQPTAGIIHIDDVADARSSIRIEEVQ